MTTRLRSRRCNRQGAVALELVLVLTFIFIPLLVGIWEVGALLSAQQTLAEAVREGGRAAASGDQTNAEVQQVVLSYLQYGLGGNASTFNTANVVVTVSVAGGGDASTAVQLTPITVTATVPFSNVNWSMAGYFVQNSSLLVATSTWNSANDITFPAPTAGPVQ